VVIAHVVRCSGIDDRCSWGGDCAEWGCIAGCSDQVTISWCSKRSGTCAFIHSVALIPGSFEVDAVSLTVSWQTAVVACSFVVCVCIAGCCVVFSMLFLSAHFGGMIVDFAVCAFVLLKSISSSATATATVRISATGE
jgi:hypothetical protein